MMEEAEARSGRGPRTGRGYIWGRWSRAPGACLPEGAVGGGLRLDGGEGIFLSCLCCAVLRVSVCGLWAGLWCFACRGARSVTRFSGAGCCRCKRVGWGVLDPAFGGGGWLWRGVRAARVAACYHL